MEDARISVSRFSRLLTQPQDLCLQRHHLSSATVFVTSGLSSKTHFLLQNEQKSQRKKKLKKKLKIHVHSLNNPAPKSEFSGPSATEQQGSAGQGISPLRVPPLCLIQPQHQHKNSGSWYTALCPEWALAAVTAGGATGATGGFLVEQGGPVFAPGLLLRSQCMPGEEFAGCSGI